MNVLIVGMHRSGTSAVAGALGAAGFRLGPPDELVAGLPENPEGFFERPDLVALDDRMLSALGWRWDTPDPMPLAKPPRLTRLVNEGRALIRSKLAGHDPWAIKDPRMSLLMPWWRRILLDRFVAVVCLRAPEEVAWSLAVRDGFPFALGLALWAAYHRHLAAGLEGLPVIGIDYGALSEEPAARFPELIAGLQGLGARGPFDLDTALATIRPELRRPTQPDSSLAGSTLTASLMEINRRWTDEGPVWVRERLQIELPEPDGWESGLLDTHRRARDAELEKSSLALEFDEQRATLHAIERNHQELTQAVPSLEKEIAILRADADIARSRISELESEARTVRAEYDLQRGQTETLIADLRADKESLSDDTSRHRAENDRQRLRIAELEASADESSRYRAENDQQRLRIADLEAAADETARYRAEIDRQRLRIADLEAAADETARYRAEIDRQRLRIAELETSAASSSVLALPRRAARSLSRLVIRGLVKFVPATLLGHVWHNPLFDPQWYVQAYGGVSGMRTDPEREFRSRGARERRNPNPLFDTDWYLVDNPDVAAQGMNPLDHYFLFGGREGRDPSPSFDSDWYLANNPDVAAEGQNPLLHYLRYGAHEGRQPHPETAGIQGDHVR